MLDSDADIVPIPVYLNVPFSSSDLLSSNATVSDRGGAGRTLGLFYQKLGRYIDYFCNTIAKRRDYGSQLTTERILKSLECCYEYSRSGARLSSNFGFDYGSMQNIQQKLSSTGFKKVIKDCRRLMKLAKSTSPTIQEEALCLINTLCSNEPVFWHLLKFKLDGANKLSNIFQKANKLYRRGYSDEYCQADIITLSRRALTCIEETRIMILGQNIQSFDPFSGPGLVSSESFDQLVTFIRNPSFSFLVFRILSRRPSQSLNILSALIIHGHIENLKIFHKEIETFLERCSHNEDEVEWPVLDRLLEDYYCKMLTDIDFLENSPNRTLEDERSLSGLIGRIPYHLEIRSNLKPEYIESHQWHIFVEQCRIKRALSSVLHNFDSFSAMCIMENFTNFMSREPWRQRSLTLRDFALDVLRKILVRHVIERDVQANMVLEGACWGNELSSLCEGLVFRLLEARSKNIRRRIAFYMNIIARIDRYCFNALSDALSKAGANPAATIPSHPRFYFSKDNHLPIDWHFSAPGSERWRAFFRGTLCRHIVPETDSVHIFCVADYDLTDRTRVYQECRHCVYSTSPRRERGRAESTLEVLRLSDEDKSWMKFIWLEIKDGTFDAKDHCPVVVWNTARGQKQYIARVPRTPYFSSIMDGATEVSYLTPQGTKTSTHFHVLVLRYEPRCSQPNGYGENNGAEYFWTPYNGQESGVGHLEGWFEGCGDSLNVDMLFD